MIDRRQKTTRTALITGATSGMGRYLASALARRGWALALHGRIESRCVAVANEVRAIGARASYYVADLAALQEVTDLGARVSADHPRLDLLVNNAGVGFGADQRKREVSQDGFELRLAVNHLAPVQLDRSLRPTLDAARGHVLNMGSAGQEEIDFDDPQFTHDYDGTSAYMRSKFALTAYTIASAEEHASTHVAINCIHPATFMDTKMVRQAGVHPHHSVEDGVHNVLDVIEHHDSGQYYEGNRPALPHPRAEDVSTQQRLVELTDSLLPTSD